MPRLRVGLTGGIASGKSTVAELLAGHGAVVVDAALLAREAVAPGSPGLAAVVKSFGDVVLTPAGDLDRPALGRIVFADPESRGRLEAIVHPEVRRLAEERVEAAGDAIVVQMIPLLVETGQQDRFDAVVVVDVPEAVQRDRLVARDGLSFDEVERRLRAQATRGQRLAVADVVLDNTVDRRGLAEVVDALWALLSRRAAAGTDPPVGQTGSAQNP